MKKLHIMVYQHLDEWSKTASRAELATKVSCVKNVGFLRERIAARCSSLDLQDGLRSASAAVLLQLETR